MLLGSPVIISGVADVAPLGEVATGRAYLESCLSGHS